MGFVTSDGTPTNRYKEFRNSHKSGTAVADAMRELYETLFEMNEYAYDLNTNELKEMIVEATGAEADSTVVKKTLSTFEALKKIAQFEDDTSYKNEVSPVDEEILDTSIQPREPIHQYSHNQESSSNRNTTAREAIHLSYTINLNLPATTDIDVFNAIFKSLKQHLIQE